MESTRSLALLSGISCGTTKIKCLSNWRYIQNAEFPDGRVEIYSVKDQKVGGRSSGYIPMSQDRAPVEATAAIDATRAVE